MPNGRKISQFPAAAGINNADVVGGVQNGVSTKFSFATIFLWLKSVLIPSDIGAVPTTRTVNGKSLTNDISLNATDVGARDASWMPSATDVGARPNTWTPSAADVGAIPTTAKGAPLGVAELDSNGQVPSSQLDLSGKQDEITASGILKGDGAGGVSAATAGTDYQAPLTAGTDYATPGMIPTVPSISTTAPAMDGTGAAGSTGEVSDAGHVHPTDASRVPVYGLGKNLLDNAYFANPVNQRGQSSYSTIGYAVDRWKNLNFQTVVTVGNGGIKLKSSVSGGSGIIDQYINTPELLLEKTVTVTMYSSTGVETHTFSMPSSYVAGYIMTGTRLFVGANADGTVYVRIVQSYTWDLTIYAVKLELGSEQTLAHLEGSTWVLNEIPDYEQELIRCQTSTADPSDTYANKSLATEQQLALVEQGTTASQNLAIGDYFVLSGLSYRVNGDPIPAGGTIDPGVNCVEDKVSGHAYTASIANGQTYVLNGIRDRMCILAFKRNNNVAVYLLDYWAANGVLVAGSPINGISVTKSANSSTVTISNSTGFAMAYTLIR